MLIGKRVNSQVGDRVNERCIVRTALLGLALAALQTAVLAATEVPSYVQPANTPEEFLSPTQTLAKSAAALAVTPSVIDLGQWDGVRTKDASVKRDGVTQVAAVRASAVTTDVPHTRQQLQWQTTARGGQIAAMSFASGGAFGMRLGVVIDQLPGNALLRVYSQSNPGDVFEISAQRVLQVLDGNLKAGDASAAGRTWWTPAAYADEVTLEIELPPGQLTSAVQIAVPSVLHFYTDLSHEIADESAAQADSATPKIGEAAYCENDATCYSQGEGQRNAVARMIFVLPDGAYLCTGTLLADKAQSGTPYFVTANHCINSQTVASTLQTDWFYRSSSCNANTLSSATRNLKNGATLLYGSADPDVTLLRLNDTPPAGAVFAGWDAGSQQRSADVLGLHHPKGDLLKVSMGAIDGAGNCSAPDAQGTVRCMSESATSMTGNYYRVKWSQGTSEGGSSGSGLFRNGKLTGVLSSGSGSCFSFQAYTFYGRFDSIYPALQKWLDAAPQGLGPRTAVYRFYNFKTDAHFYTASVAERDWVIKLLPEYQYDNVGFYAYPTEVAGKQAVFRFYNWDRLTHFFTINAAERDQILQTQPRMQFDGPVWYAQANGSADTVPVYRFRNLNSGADFYTTSEYERSLVNTFKSYAYQGIAYFVWSAP